MESDLRGNPDDLETRKKLMIYYQAKRPRTPDVLNAFRRHKLWFIEHHPEDPSCARYDPRPDQESDREERQLWLAVLKRKGLPPHALGNAAHFFATRDPDRAEQILLQLTATAPDERWTRLLAILYENVLGGPAVQTPFGVAVRRRLENSDNASLLYETGGRLLDHRRSAEAKALSRLLLERSIAIEPHGSIASLAQRRLRALGEEASFRNFLDGVRDQNDYYPAAMRLPESERPRALNELATIAYRRGNTEEQYKSDPAAGRRSQEWARRMAQEALSAASRVPSAPGSANAAYSANLTLGLLAIRIDNDGRKATQYLLAAAKAPATGITDWYWMDWELPYLLLRYGGAGGRDAVLEYLDTMAGHSPEAEYQHSAQQIRAGIMPRWYQSRIQWAKQSTAPTYRVTNK